MDDRARRFLDDRDLFDDLRHPICLIGDDGQLLYANAAFGSILRAVIAIPVDGTRLSFVHDPIDGLLSVAEIPPEDWAEAVDYVGQPSRYEGATAYHLYEQRQTAVGAFLEETLRELDGVNKLKSDFLTRVTHELNTPLTAILGFSEILLDPSDLDRDVIEEFCREIWRASRRIHSIVNDILNLTRLDAGLLDYHFEILDFDEMVATTAEGQADEFDLKKVRLVVEPAGGLDPIKCDRERIRDVLARLLNNALTYSEPGQEVVVRTRSSEREVVCTVCDQGRGLSQAEIDRIFQEFSQIGDIQHHQVGLGLGLALSKRVIEEGHGGRLWVESEGHGLGASVSISLPRFLVD